MNTLARNRKILITGSGGQLGQALAQEVKCITKGFDYIFLSKSELDITDKDIIESVLNTHTPDIVINTAAYTAVDAAEDDQETAYLINETAVFLLADACKNRNIGLLHISTDYVFDGEQSTPYTETDLPNPKTVYGASKLAGEQAILEANLDFFVIIRTSWVYSSSGANFVKTMLRLAKERSELSVVNDQIGSPTYANDLAQAILNIASRLNATNSGVYHYANSGSVSWYAFAKAIFHQTNTSINLTKVTSDQFPSRAKRPKYSLLDTTKISRTFNIDIPKWEHSLHFMIDTYLN